MKLHKINPPKIIALFWLLGGTIFGEIGFDTAVILFFLIIEFDVKFKS